MNVFSNFLPQIKRTNGDFDWLYKFQKLYSWEIVLVDPIKGTTITNGQSDGHNSTEGVVL